MNNLFIFMPDRHACHLPQANIKPPQMLAKFKVSNTCDGFLKEACGSGIFFPFPIYKLVSYLCLKQVSTVTNFNINIQRRKCFNIMN